MIDWDKTKIVFENFDINGYRPKVCIKCDNCGKESILTIRVKNKLKNNNIDWLCHKCIGKRNSKILSDKTKKLWKNENYRNKISSNSQKMWNIEEYRSKIVHSKDDFIIKSNKIHNHKYNYDKVKYINSFTNVTIICPIHGIFEQLPNNHLKGNGCPKCSYGILTNEELIKRFNEIHENKYDYSNTVYINSYSKIKIRCPVHGEFEQIPTNHYNGNGCPKCSNIISKSHKEIIDFINLNKIINDRNVISPYELDIYLPDLKIAIEFHGLYYHSYSHMESKKERYKHYLKSDICNEIGIKLIQIFEDEWLFKDNIVKSILNSKFGVAERIFARKCEVVELSSSSFNEFCDFNHIQGRLNSNIKLGLIHDDKIVCVMGFNKKKEIYECTRFCNVLNKTIVGGASRLFQNFLNKYNPRVVTTFADRRYSDGNLYKKLGFKLINVTKPGYFYVKNTNRYNRTLFQKHKLKNKLKCFDPKLSESINMFNNGFRRIWDAGHYKFIYKNDGFR